MIWFWTMLWLIEQRLNLAVVLFHNYYAWRWITPPPLHAHINASPLIVHCCYDRMTLPLCVSVFDPNPYHVPAPWPLSSELNPMAARLCWCLTVPTVTSRTMGGCHLYKNSRVLTSAWLDNSLWPLMDFKPRSVMFNCKLMNSLSVLLRVCLPLDNDGPRIAK